MKRHLIQILNALIVLLAISSYCFGPPVADPPVPVWGNIAQWTILGGALFISVWKKRK